MEDITLTLTPGSVVVEATITTAGEVESDQVVTTLNAFDPPTMSAAIGIPIVAINSALTTSTLIVLSPPPSPSPPSPAEPPPAPSAPPPASGNLSRSDLQPSMSEANSADGCGLAADTVSPEIYVIMLLACLLIIVLIVLFIFSTKLKAAEQRHGDSEEQLKAAGAARDKAAREQLIAADARASSAEAKLTKLEQDHKFLKQQHKKALEAAQTAEEAAEAAEAARKAAEEREAAAQEMIREMNKQRERQ